MAGIGFELKKIFKRGGVFSTLHGIAYATAVTIGPMVSIIAILMLLYRFLDFLSLSYAQRELLTGAIMYVFIFAMIITSPVNGILSRYVADKLFLDQKDEVLPSFYMGLVINVIFGALLGIPFVLFWIAKGGVNPVFALSAYAMFMSLLCTFFCMTYVSALKDFAGIGNAFFFGMLAALGIGYALFRLEVTDTSLAILLGMTSGFTLISFLLYGHIQAYFRTASRGYRQVLPYFRKYGMLFFSSLFYALGLYAHNFVAWQSDLGILVGGVIRVAPVYDAATCYAMFTNISALVLFVVQVETRFHEKYRRFCDAVIGGGAGDIRLAKEGMFHSIAREIGYMLQMQLLITMSLYIGCLLLLPLIGVAGLTLSIYPVLAVAYMIIYIMYMLIVFMYYLEDHRGALLTAAVFLISTVAASYLAMEHLSQNLYGVGAFAGAFMGWTVGFFRLRWLEKHFDKHVFCDGRLTV